MHVLEAAIAANILARNENPDRSRLQDLADAPQTLGPFCLLRAIAAIGGVALFVLVLNLAAGA